METIKKKGERAREVSKGDVNAHIDNLILFNLEYYRSEGKAAIDKRIEELDRVGSRTADERPQHTERDRHGALLTTHHPHSIADSPACRIGRFGAWCVLGPRAGAR